MDVAEPVCGPEDVVVRVRAAAFNHLDLWTVNGELPFEIDYPFVLGADGAGEVEVTGERVRGIKPGARVIVDPALSCGRCERCRAGEQSNCVSFEMLGEHRNGTMAQRVCVPATNVYPFPDHLGFEQAAALGVTSITAYRMLFTRGRFRPGEWVLITGIGGGLALSLLQLSVGVAGRIFVTSSSPEKIERALQMGATDGIDYKKVDVGKEVRRLTSKRGVDLVCDSAGGDTLDGSMRALRPGGRIVIAGATAGSKSTIDVRRLFWNQIEVIGSTMGSASDVSDMLRMVAGARIEPVIDRIVDLQDAPDGLAAMAAGDRFGKVVVRIA